MNCLPGGCPHDDVGEVGEQRPLRRELHLRREVDGAHGGAAAAAAEGEDVGVDLGPDSTFNTVVIDLLLDS